MRRLAFVQSESRAPPGVLCVDAGVHAETRRPIGPHPHPSPIALPGPEISGVTRSLTLVWKIWGLWPVPRLLYWTFPRLPERNLRWVALTDRQSE